MPGTVKGFKDAVITKADIISNFVGSKIQWGVR